MSSSIYGTINRVFTGFEDITKAFDKIGWPKVGEGLSDMNGSKQESLLKPARDNHLKLISKVQDQLKIIDSDVINATKVSLGELNYADAKAYKIDADKPGIPVLNGLFGITHQLGKLINLIPLQELEKTGSEVAKRTTEAFKNALDKIKNILAPNPEIALRL